VRPFLALAFAFCVALCGMAQTTQSQLLAIDSAFVKGQYQDVELLTLRLLQSPEQLSAQERARVNLTAGYALIMQGREPEAREYFSRALDAEPTLTLDPVQVSPKFRVVFDEVKASHPIAKPEVKPAPPTIRNGPSQAAVISNLIIPGSGLWREGYPIRGGVFILAQAASVGAFVYELAQARDAHADYLAETNASRIPAAYDTYNRHYQDAWGSGSLMALVYVAAQVDLAVSRGPNKEISFRPFPGPGTGIGLTVRW